MKILSLLTFALALAVGGAFAGASHEITHKGKSDKACCKKEASAKGAHDHAKGTDGEKECCRKKDDCCKKEAKAEGASECCRKHAQGETQECCAKHASGEAQACCKKTDT